MKRFYLILFSVVLAFSGILSANAISITVNVDNPEAVDIKVAYTSIGTVKATNVLTVNEYAQVEIIGNTGYRVMSVQNPSGDAVGYLYASSNAWYQNMYSSNEGDVYNVTTKTDAEYRDGSCKIKVDVKENVRVQLSNTYTTIDYLVDNEFVDVKFNKEQELPIVISSSTSNPLYKVTVNGTVQTSSSSYRITPTADTDEIVVESNYPDKDCKVNFVYANEGTSDFITSVTANGTAVKNYNAAEGFTVKAGTSLAFTGNTSDYKFNSMKIGEENVTYFNGNYNSIIKDNTTITIDVNKYATLTGVIKINNIEGVKVFTNYYDDTSIIAITSNEQEITRNEQNPKIYIKPNSGYKVNSVTAGGNEVSADYQKIYTITLTNDMVINVDVTPIVYNDKALIYINKVPTPYFLCAKSFEGRDREVAKTVGYTNISFDKDSENPLRVTWYDYDVTSTCGAVYLNDVECAKYYGNEGSYYITISNGDIIKIYPSTTPSFYDVTFTISGVNASDIDVKKDIITEVTDLAAGFSALTGTQVDITPAEGKNINVSVNDEAITADNGVYSFNVTAATAVKIEEATGINSISSDDKADNKVYTVQGVRVNNVKNLPAGLYIVNGKTRVVK